MQMSTSDVITHRQAANGASRRALVVGLGVTGIATALRLRQIGWTPTIVERASARRTGGYFIALFGAGLASARRLGILDHLTDRGPRGASYDIDRAGNRKPTFSFQDFPGPPWMMRRGDLEAAAFAALPTDVEIRFGTGPAGITSDATGVDVTFTDTATTERFDLVIGADGLRSTVRQLVFGPHDKHLRRLNHMVAAFQLPGPLPGHDLTDTVIMLEPGRSFWAFPFPDHPPTALLNYRTDDVTAEFTETMIQRVRSVFGPKPTGPVLGAVLDALESAEDVLFDSVEQVHLDRWHHGRVVLVGDSAWCPTLYSGMGASSGMAGADLLGTMLAHHPDDVTTALARWEAHLRPTIELLQASGTQMRGLFVPSRSAQLFLRRILARLNRYPVAGPLLASLRNRGKAFRLKDADFAAPESIHA